MWKRSFTFCDAHGDTFSVCHAMSHLETMHQYILLAYNVKRKQHTMKIKTVRHGFHFICSSDCRDETAPVLQSKLSKEA